MITQTHSNSRVLPIGKGKDDQKDQAGSTEFVQAKKRKFLQALTVLTWIVAALVSIAFYFSVRMNLAEADWLACILLGMVFLGWILFAMYVHATGKPVPPAGQGERQEKKIKF